MGWRRPLRRLRSRVIRHYYSTLALIALLALALRLLHSWYANYSPFSDMSAYIVFMLRAFYKQDPLSPGTLLFPPGYPFFLYLITSLYGLQSIKPIQYAQAALDSGAIILLAGITRYIAGCRAGIWAALLYALYLPAILNCGLLMSECVTTALLILSTWSFVAVLKRPGILRGGLCGVFIGLATLVRSNVLLLSLVFSGALLLRAFRGKRLSIRVMATAAALLLGSVLVIVPWSIRNSRIAGRPTFIATNSGVNLLIGNNPIANGGWSDFIIADESDKKTTDALELPALYRHQAIEFAASHPAHELFFLIPERVKRLYDEVQAYWPWEYFPGGGYFEYPFGPFIYCPTISFTAIFVLGLFGCLAKSRHPAVLPMVWLTLVLPLMAFFVIPRFRYVSDFAIIASAGVLLSRLNIGNRLLPYKVATGFLLLVMSGSLLYWLRFSGPDLLRTDAFSDQTAMATQLKDEILTIGPTDPATRKPITVGKLSVNPQRASDLLISYNCRITSCSEDLDSRGITPDIRLVYSDKDGKPVGQPVTPPAGVLSSVQGLSSFQSHGTAVWRIIPVPPLTRLIELQVFSTVSADVEMWGLRIRGPRWYAADVSTSAALHQ